MHDDLMDELFHTHIDKKMCATVKRQNATKQQDAVKQPRDPTEFAEAFKFLIDAYMKFLSTRLPEIIVDSAGNIRYRYTQEEKQIMDQYLRNFKILLEMK